MKENKIEHKEYEKLLAYSKAKDNKGFPLPIILHGPAGTSKSSAAEQLAEDLGLEFGALPMSQHTTKSDLIGFMTPSGDSVMSLFAKFYEHGGVFVLEEVDAANMNVLLTINAAIASHQGFFGGKMIQKSKNLHLIATANTLGGSTEQYSARSKFDGSFLTRFLKLEWELDENFEAALLESTVLSSSIKRLRVDLGKKGIYLSMREALSYKSLIDAGIPYKEAADSTLLFQLEGSLRLELYNILRPFEEIEIPEILTAEDLKQEQKPEQPEDDGCASASN